MEPKVPPLFRHRNCIHEAYLNVFDIAQVFVRIGNNMRLCRQMVVSGLENVSGRWFYV